MNNKRLLHNGNDVERLSEYLEDGGFTFSHQIGRYSQKYIVDEMNNQYIVSPKSRKCFIAYNMILKDVKLNFIPEIKEEKVKYHNTNLIPIYADKIFATDINSAYANVLFNDDIISKETFNFICTLTKGERLAAVGMLASKNNTYVYKDGELIDCIRYENPYSKIFLYAVGKVYNIMIDVKKILQEDFLYSWVDCVYYSNKKRCHRIVNECLNDYKLKYKSLWLNEFEVREDFLNYTITYKKGDFFSKLITMVIPKLTNNRKIKIDN